MLANRVKDFIPDFQRNYYYYNLFYKIYKKRKAVENLEYQSRIKGKPHK